MTKLVCLDGHTQCGASAIANDGTVVGFSQSAQPGSMTAVYWDASHEIHSLGQLAPGWETYARAVNNHGLIVGTATTSGAPMAWFYDLAVGHFAKLSPDTTLSHAQGVNDNGEIVGDFLQLTPSPSAGAIPAPVKWTANPYAVTPLTPLQWMANPYAATPLHTDNTGSGTALAINAAGAIVGETRAGAALWPSAGAAAILLSPEIGSSSRAVDINDSGIIVGSISAYAGQDIMLSRAVRWTADRKLEWLVDANSQTSSYAYAINKSGAIVGIDADRATQF